MNKLNFFQPCPTLVSEPRFSNENRILAAVILIRNASPITINATTIRTGCADAMIWKESSVGIKSEFAYSLN